MNAYDIVKRKVALARVRIDAGDLEGADRAIREAIPFGCSRNDLEDGLGRARIRAMNAWVIDNAKDPSATEGGAL